MITFKDLKGVTFKGIPLTFDKVSCPVCNGTGQIQEYRTDLDDLGPASQAEFLLCDECYGTGWIDA